MSTGRLLIAVVSPSFTSVLDHGRGPRGLSHATQSGHISNSLTSPERFISGNRPEKASPRWPRWSIASEAVHRIAACSLKNQARPQPVAGSFPPSRPPPGSPSTLRRSLPLLVDLCSPTLSGTRGVAQGWGQRLASFAASSLLKVPPSHFPGRGGLQVWPREPRVNLRWRLMNGCHPGLEHTGLLPTRLTHGPGQLLNVARPGRGDLPETDNAVSLPSEMHRVARQPLNRGGDSQAGSEDSTIAQHGSQSSPWAGVVGLGSSARPGRLAGGSMPPQLLALGPSASAGRWSPFSTLFTAL